MLVVERVAALHRVELFARVPGRTLAAVAATAEEVAVEPGSTFIEHGAVEDCLYVVVSGRVRVHRGDRTLVELGAGSVVGELAVLVPEPRSASVTALEPTLLLRVRKVVLDELLSDRPELRARRDRRARRAPQGGRRARGCRRLLTGMTEPAPRRVVALLAGQAFAFGLSESLLLIVANAIFLDAYGSKWLPLTYVGIAVAGTLVAAGVARTVRRWPLPRVAIVTEASVALLFVAAWAVLTASGGAWVSAPLLVLFPVLLQIGFVFVGGQAGRLLDVQQIKSGFPRIVSGFADRVPRGRTRRQAAAGAPGQPRSPAARRGRRAGRLPRPARRRGPALRRSARPGRERLPSACRDRRSAGCSRPASCCSSSATRSSPRPAPT